MNYSAHINCARPRLGDRRDTAQISPPSRCHGCINANRLTIKRNNVAFERLQNPEGSRDATTQKASRYGRGSVLAAGENQFTETSAKSSFFPPFFFFCFSRFYLSGLRPGFGGRGSLKSSRLTPCSTALSPAPRTHGRARSRAHRTWSGEGGGREQEEEEEEMGEARIVGRGGHSQTR